MKKRASLIGGNIEIESTPKRGTTIHVRLLNLQGVNPSSRVTNENPDSQTIDDLDRQLSAFADRLSIDINSNPEKRFFQTVKVPYRFIALSIGLILLVVTASKLGMFEFGRRTERSEMLQKMQLKKFHTYL